MLIGNMTLDQKINQIINGAHAIPELGVPQYDYWSEASHGVAWSGRATVFPSPIAMGATFDTEIMELAGRVVAIEARGKHNDYTAKNHNNSGTFYGLDFYAPNINLFIHSLWTRSVWLTAKSAAFTFVAKLNTYNARHRKMPYNHSKMDR